MNTAIRPEGALTLDTIVRHLDALGGPLPAAEDICIDLSGVHNADSSAVALLLDWQRKVTAAGSTLKLTGIPENLQQLIAVYGLTDLLP